MSSTRTMALWQSLWDLCSFAPGVVTVKRTVFLKSFGRPIDPLPSMAVVFSGMMYIVRNNEMVREAAGSKNLKIAMLAKCCCHDFCRSERWIENGSHRFSNQFG